MGNDRHDGLAGRHSKSADEARRAQIARDLALTRRERVVKALELGRRLREIRTTAESGEKGK